MTRSLRMSLPATIGLRALSRGALGCLLGAALLVAGTPAARAGDDDVPIDRKIFRNILEGLGLKRDGEAINYEERAPLVVPPTRDLPPPESSDAVLAKNPAWPNDPDVARRKVERAQERNRNISEEREREQNPLSPDQITPGGRPKAQRTASDDGYQSPANGYDNQLPPDKLGVPVGSWLGGMFGSKKQDEAARFTKEPPRTALTEPPPGYQTPSPDQPYGLTKQTVAPKPNNYYETHGTLEGRN